MLTQDVIEEFFLNMISELRKDNVYILNEYGENFRNYPYKIDIEISNIKADDSDEYYNSTEEN